MISILKIFSIITAESTASGEVDRIQSKKIKRVFTAK